MCEATAVLAALCRLRAAAPAGPWAVRAQSAIVRHRLHLLAALANTPIHGYLPDFLNPEPIGYDTDVDQELHQVAITPPARIRAEMDASAQGRPGSRLRGTAPSQVLRDALQRGEQAVAQRIAIELHTLWTSAIRPHWAGMRRRLEDDIEARTRLATRAGLAAAWRSVDRRLSIDDTGLHIDSAFEIDITRRHRITFVPSCVEPTLATFIDPCRERGTVLQYPASPGVDRQAQPASDPTAAVLGATRAVLLGSLDAARTTQELSRLHGLTPATISYHLTRMHRAGLLTRHRTGIRVYYRRTPSAEILLRSAG
jgi:hypothetical protein